MTNFVSADVLTAIHDGATRVTRRLEIYEADGQTLWSDVVDTPRLIEGNVTVDYDRDERRALDCTLDNSDALISHGPDGLWYDKVIKVYRGVTYDNSKTSPTIYIIRDDSSAYFSAYLRSLGFTDLVFATSATTLDELQGADIVAAAAGTSTTRITAAHIQLLNDAYAAGFNIMTQGTQVAQVGNLPFVTAALNKTDTNGWEINRPVWDTPIANGWVSTTLPTSTATGWIPTMLDATAIACSILTVSATQTYPLVAAQNVRGARWFHYGVETRYIKKKVIDRTLTNALNYLYDYEATRTWEAQIGEFLIDRINETQFPRTIKITGRDYTKKLIGAKFLNATTFKAGTPVDTVIQAIASNGGITKFLLGATGFLLDADMTFDRASERWKAISDIATASGVEVFFDGQGYLVSRPFRDPATSPANLVLSAGLNLVSYNKSSNDGRIANYVVVTGENPDDLSSGIFFQATAINTEPTSPTRVALLGERHYFYTSALFVSTLQCQTTADNFLKVMGLEEYEFSFESLVFPWAEAGEILLVVDPESDVDDPGRYLLTSFSLPLGLGPMGGTARRVSIVGSGSVPEDLNSEEESSLADVLGDG